MSMLSYETYVPAYLDFVRQHRGRRTTHQLEDCLGRFFRFLAKDDLSDLHDLTVCHIRKFLSCLQHYKSTTIATHASALRCFLRYLHMQGVLKIDICRAVESPRIYRNSHPPEILDEEKVEQLLAAVNRSTALGKRDYAVLLLAACCGLRPSDIRNLRFEHIQWREQRLVFVQSKTQRLLELPLLVDVDSALVDYLRHGRPSFQAREIFVRHVAPIRPFDTSMGIEHIMYRALRMAGIELSTPRRGIGLLRHSLATRLLRQDVPFDTISDILGHATVETTRVYAQVDLVGLRSVALSKAEVDQ